MGTMDRAFGADIFVASEAVVCQFLLTVDLAEVRGLLAH